MSSKLPKVGIDTPFHPIHIELLKLLPVEGETDKFLIATKSSKQLSNELQKLKDWEVTGNYVGGVLRSLQQSGFVTHVKMTGNTIGWLATKEGKKVVDK